MTRAEQIEKLIDAAFSVMHHDADHDGEAAIYERETLRRKFGTILGKSAVSLTESEPL